MSGWRYIAARETGDGVGQVITHELPLTDVIVTPRLSGPPSLTGTIPVEMSQLRNPDGTPMFRKWNTSIYAEDPNGQLYGGLLIDSAFDGPKWLLDVAGFSYYPKDQPYVWEAHWVQVDPLWIHAHIWDQLQSLPGGNFGVEINPLESPVRIGEEEDPAATTSAGPYRLNWWSTHDLGAEIDNLATDTPFDWVEEHYWDGEVVRHRIRRGYPRIGRRRQDQRLAIGENVTVIPQVPTREYASHALVLGQGEGRDRVAGDDGRTGQVRRVAVIDDKTATNRDMAVERARRALAVRDGRPGLADGDELELISHPNAPLGEVSLGDEFFLEGWTGWVDLSQWVRLTSMSISPARSDRIRFTVAAADLVGEP